MKTRRKEENIHFSFTSMTDWTGTTNYSYDNIYQLTSATYPNTGTQNFTYDQAGNRIQDQNRIYYYNNLNQLLYTSDGTNYTYDLNGNLIQKTKGTETTTYTWNEFDRLVEVNLPDGKKIRFVYGADGLRRERIEEERVNYLLDGVAVLCEFDDSLNLLREYVGGVSVCIGSESFYYHYDRLGSVRFVSDSGGSVVCDYVYDAFGNILSSSGTLSQPYQYIGQHGYYREAVFNLYLLGQRWYDSEVGRFISRDPIGEKGGINLYAYARNNSINLTDPEGEKIVCWGVDVSSSVVVIKGKIWGFSIYSCYDTCKKCSWDVYMGYICSCWGLGIGVGASFEGCIAETLGDVISGNYTLIGGSYKDLCGTISGSKNLKCTSFGSSIGIPPISGYICECKVDFSFSNNCCGK